VFCPDCGTWNRAAAARCARCGVTLPELASAPVEAPDPELSALRRAAGGRYRIVRRIGGGGMANVYYAEHPELGRPLVIKVLHAHLAREAEMRERFRREAEAAAGLQHPHVCPIIDYGSAGQSVYIVLPFLAGGSLADQLTRERVVAPAQAASVCAQVSAALDYAHRKGIVHRDVKPDNVLFDDDRYALLTDFGIATARFHARLTGTGRAMGTPHYMSPEQAMGKMVDGRSDIYAVGVMLYEMLLGFPPFDGADSYSVGYKHVHEQPVPPEIVDSRTPPALAAIVMRCLAKAPNERYQRGMELADALLAFVAGQRAPTEQRAAWLSRLSGVSTPIGQA
jgi:serine/threonine-protein kinase